MRIIEPGFEILTDISEDGIQEYKNIEKIARVCYKSEDRITEDGESAKKIISMLINKGHEAMLEHGYLTVKFICDRGVSHELVRHRIASWAQESTRYVNYAKEQFGHEITVIKPCFWNDDLHSKQYNLWKESCEKAEQTYFELLHEGATPQEARSVLPNSTKTEIVMTANYREWRHFLKLRTASDAHPQMQQIARPLLDKLKTDLLLIFSDIIY